MREREDADLARAAFFLHEQGYSTKDIALQLEVSTPTVVNLIGFGRRLAAGQGERLEWDQR